MPDNGWTAVDDYLTGTLVKPDPVFDEILRRSQAAGLPAINVSPTQGRLLEVLARTTGARHVLEIGTLGGYSTAWLARGIGERGRIVTIEAERRHAELAREHLDLAGLGERVEIRVGPAEQVLEQLATEPREPFDLVFIDADKPGYTGYLSWSLRLGRPGTLLIADNIVRGGAVADPATADANAVGIRRFLEAAAAEPRLVATGIQTVGAKGYDGLAFLTIVEG